MTSLTRISIIARKTIRYGIFAVILLIIGNGALNMGITIYKKAFPAPPPPPTVKFGKLSKIPFPVRDITAKFNYKVETPNGGLPTDLPTQAKVFLMPKPNSNLLALDMAKAIARNLNFEFNPQEISDTIYSFTDPKVPTTLKINIITKAFSISYNLALDNSPLKNKPAIAEIAASQFRSFLSTGGVLPSDLTGVTTSSFLKFTNGELVNALSLSESDLIKINLFRKKIDNLPSVTAIPDQANVWAMMSGSREKNQSIIAAEYHYFPVDETQYATYPLKSVTQAYTELQNNQSFIASTGLNKDGDTIIIRKIYLAYFDPDTVAEFFEPVFVLEGDNGFVSYVPAVNSDYYQSN